MRLFVTARRQTNTYNVYELIRLKHSPQESVPDSFEIILMNSPIPENVIVIFFIDFLNISRDEMSGSEYRHLHSMARILPMCFNDSISVPKRRGSQASFLTEKMAEIVNIGKTARLSNFLNPDAGIM